MKKVHNSTNFAGSPIDKSSSRMLIYCQMQYLPKEIKQYRLETWEKSPRLKNEKLIEDAELRLILELAKESGLTRKEILNLGWDHVDLDNGTIMLIGDNADDCAPSEAYIGERLKTKLNGMRMKICGPVFPNPFTGRPYNDAYIVLNEKERLYRFDCTIPHCRSVFGLRQTPSGIFCEEHYLPWRHYDSSGKQRELRRCLYCGCFEPPIGCPNAVSSSATTESADYDQTARIEQKLLDGIFSFEKSGYCRNHALPELPDSVISEFLDIIMEHELYDSPWDIQ